MADNRILDFFIIILGVFSVGLTISDRPVLLSGSTEACPQDYYLKIAFCAEQQLKSVPNYLPQNIERLYLEQNFLTVLRSDSFSRYPELRWLNLAENNISRIEAGAFSALNHLQRLFLWKNPFLPNLEGNMLKHPSLMFLFASRVNLEYFSGDSLSWFANDTNGAHLDLSYNKLQEMKWEVSKIFKIVYLSHNEFQELSKYNFVMNSIVLSLDLSGNPLKVIDSATIASLQVREFNIGGTNLNETQIVRLLWGIKESRFIKSFKFQNAGLENVPLGIFKYLAGKDLDRLDLSFNNLRELPHQGFSGLSGVSMLVLRSNYLKSIDPHQFDGLTALRTLILDENEIASINSNDTLWKLSILEMDLSENNLGEIHSFTFRGLKNLEKLDLSHNSNLDIVGQGTFLECSSLKELDLSWTSISSLSSLLHIPFLTTLNLESASFPSALIEPGHFGSGMPLLERLELQETLLMSHEIWDAKNRISSFDGLHQLLFLDLSYNFFVREYCDGSHLPVGVFQNLTSLSTLFLEDSLIKKLEVGLFSDLDSLTILNLENNFLTELPYGLFDQIKNLQQLFLDGNDLTSLGPDLFKFTQSLHVLHVKENYIATLSLRTFQPIYSTLKNIDIASNPLACNCDMKWLPKWLKTSVRLKSSDETICADAPGTLESFKGKQLITFDPRDECGPNIALYSCLALMGVVLILTLGLIYYQRWWISYRLFLLKLCFIGYDEIRDDVDRRNYLHDIAVMLHEVDNEWVNQHLRPALEERLPEYDRLVCGDEELALGMHYLDAVYYAVENSFKTIFVISRAALQDQWYMLKFRTALEHVNDVGIEKMILVFVEDIAHGELPFLIRIFLSDHRPYLVWPENERGQGYFWKELVKDLKVNIRCNNLVPPEN